MSRRGQKCGEALLGGAKGFFPLAAPPPPPPGHRYRCIWSQRVNESILPFVRLDSQPVRLVNGTNRCAGRVEILYSDQWGTVCDDKWGMQEASVVCREMGCGAPLEVKYKAFFGSGDRQMWMDDVNCTGQEKSLAECSHRGFGEHDCSHHEDAGVICSGADPPEVPLGRRGHR